MITPRVTIGLDLGTSGLKAVALDESGRVVARATRDYPTARPEMGAAEQRPVEWTAAAFEALDMIAMTVRPSRWTAIGLSAMLPTLVLLDANFSPVGPAITWQDARADPQGESFREAYGAHELYRRTGQIVDGRYLIPMASRAICALPPADASAVRWIAGAKDYLFHVLTGELLTDPSTATGFGAYDLLSDRWMSDVISAVAGQAELPMVVASTEFRSLRRELSARLGIRHDVPVVVGGADSVLGAYGMGACLPGQVAYIAGTSTVVLGVSRSRVTDPARRCLVTPLADAGYGLEMDLLATGAAFSWFAGLLGFKGGPSELVDAAATVPAFAAPSVLPYLAPGEQGALWDETLRGAIFGLSLTTTPADLARGLVTGVILESRRCLTVLDELLSGGREILASGSGATSVALLRDLSDASGRAVSYDTGERDHSAVGAALLAAREAVHWQISPSAQLHTIEPDPSRAQEWSDLADLHDSLRLRQQDR